jgi:exopolysaccharide production protein ExoZ
VVFEKPQGAPDDMIWSLQILRFVAALMVLYLHAATTAIHLTGSNGLFPDALATVCRSGVDIFFVISGVIITKIARGSGPSEFIWSRLRRIVPMYLLCSIPFIATSVSTGFGWRDALATFFFWPATDRMTMPALAVGWTLCFEMLFYVSAALVLVHYRWLPVIVAAYAAALVLRPINPIFQFLGNPIILEFFFGAVLARAPAWRPGVWAVPLSIVILVGAGLSGLAPSHEALDIVYGKEAFWRVLIFGVPAAMLVYGMLQVETKESVWTYLGEASYSLYLTHVFTLNVLLAIWTIYPIPSDPIIFIGISVSLLFAWRIHERVEKPVMMLSKTYLKPGALTRQKISQARRRLSETR